MCYQCPWALTFTPFHSTTRCFQVTVHFETKAPNDPKWSWTLQGHRYPIYVLVVSLHPNCPFIFLYEQPFFEAILRQSAPNKPKRPWTLHGHKCPIYVLVVSPISNQSVSLYGELFLTNRPFWKKCIKWRQNDIKPYKVKRGPYIYILLMSQWLKFHPIFFDPSFFEIQS